LVNVIFIPPENFIPLDGKAILNKPDGEAPFVGLFLNVNKVWFDLLSIKLIELEEVLKRGGSIKIPRSLTPVVVTFDGMY
tara:strand:- start:921 stop:1160 length:240 start_codon:yes stop_codon:yes gene_type:complete